MLELFLNLIGSTHVPTFEDSIPVAGILWAIVAVGLPILEWLYNESIEYVTDGKVVRKCTVTENIHQCGYINTANGWETRWAQGTPAMVFIWFIFFLALLELPLLIVAGAGVCLLLRTIRKVYRITDKLDLHAKDKNAHS